MAINYNRMKVYQYSETNVMHFLFNLLRIMDLYMFRALLDHLASQTALGIFRACYVSWLLPGLEWKWCRRHQFHTNTKSLKN
jgi:hypothetical protein